MASDLRQYRTAEVLNKVLNTSNDSLKVDVVSGAEYAEDAEHTSADTGNFILGVRNDTLAALGGTDGDYVPFQMNSDGALYVEAAVESGQIKSGAIASGALASGSVSSGAVASGAIASGAVASGAFASGSIASGAVASGAIASGAVASGALASGSVVDGAMVTLGAKADAKSSATDTTSITAMQVLKQISASVQETATDTGTIDSDTDAINTATVASQAALEKMLYGNALVITAVDGGSTQALGATYESLYVGVGGNVVVTMVGTGNFTFSNVASGQLLPIRITHVINTNTTATNMIALKA